MEDMTPASTFDLKEV